MKKAMTWIKLFIYERLFKDNEALLGLLQKSSQSIILANEELLVTVEDAKNARL